MIDIRLLQLLEELPGIARKALHISSLAFGVYCIEGKRRLAGTGKPGHDYKLIARDLKGDILEVVLPGAFYDYAFALCHIYMNIITYGSNFHHKLALAAGGVLPGIASARRKFALGMQIYCGKILMDAEPGIQHCDRQGLGPAYS